MINKISTFKFKDLLKLTFGGGIIFWLTSIATSLLPIAAEYRAAYSNWSMQTVWIASLPMGLLIGLLVSFCLLKYFAKLPTNNSIAKSVILSLIFLIIAVFIIDAPQSFLGNGNSNSTLYYFFIGFIFNLIRFLLLGIVIGYLHKKINKEI